MSPDGAVVLSDVTVRYGRRVALESVSGAFASGSLTAVVGANGAGKSTLLGAISGTVKPAAGQVRCAARGARRLAYLPQIAALDRAYPMTVAELIALGGWRDCGAFRAPLRRCARAPHRRAVGGRVAARAVRPADRAGRGGDPAGGEDGTILEQSLCACAPAAKPNTARQAAPAISSFRMFPPCTFLRAALRRAAAPRPAPGSGALP